MTTLVFPSREKWPSRWCCAVLTLMLLFPALSCAAISVNRTRLIVTESEREASAQVLNEGIRPVLIQAWVDTGQAQAPAERIHGPFIVDPPVFRLEPGRSRQLRVLMVQTAQSLPQDRESVFWFNVLEIPPKSSADNGANHLQISFRTRMKVFFRPKAVVQHVHSKTDDLAIALKRAEAKMVFLNIHNLSPMHQTINTLAIISPKGVKITLDSFMISPGQSVDIPVKLSSNEIADSAPWQVHFSVIDDFGGVHEHEKVLMFN